MGHEEERRFARGYLEEGDDLESENRHRLWPYCLRLEKSAVAAVKEQFNGASPLGISREELQHEQDKKKLPALQRVSTPPHDLPMSSPVGSRDFGRARTAPGRAATMTTVKRPSTEQQHHRREVVPLPHQRKHVAAAERYQSREIVKEDAEIAAAAAERYQQQQSALKEDEEIAALEAELRRVEAALGEIDRMSTAMKKRQPPDAPLTLPFSRSLQRQMQYWSKKLDAENADKAARDAFQAERKRQDAAEKKAGLLKVRELGVGAHAVDAELRVKAAERSAAALEVEEEEEATHTLRRDELAARAHERRVPVPCPICGEMIPLTKMAKHVKEDCENRLVPCKNHLLGCKVLVRPLNRSWHEDASQFLKPRSCLGLPGASALCFVDLNEPDLKAPWTAEFWIWRPSAKEALLSKARAGFLKHATRLSMEQVVLTVKSDLAQLRLEAEGVFKSATHEEKAAFSVRILATQEALRAAEVDAGVARLTAFELFRHASHDLKEVSELNILKPLLGEEAGSAYTTIEGLIARLHELIAEALIGEVPPPTTADKKHHKKEEVEEEVIVEVVALTEKEKRKQKRKTAKMKQRSKATTKREALHGKPIHALIMEKFAGLAGLEALASSGQTRLLARCDGGEPCIPPSNFDPNSPKFTFLKQQQPKKKLQVGLGISMRGLGTWPIGDKPLPREKWTHVAFVCTKKKNKSFALTTFVEGEKQGELTAPFGFELPMRDLIGDRDAPQATPHGLVCEARYWATALTKTELRKGQRTFPIFDAAAPEKFFGWWTFEERGGIWLHDRSEQRYRSRLTGGTWLEADEAAGAPPQTPASLEREVCAVEVRVSRLAHKGRQLYALAPCDNNCGEEVMRCRLRSHLTYDCARRLRPCDHCGERIRTLPHEGCPALKERDRLAQLHGEGEVERDCILGCDQLVPTRAMDRHCHSQCELRRVPCPQCGLSVSFGRLATHMRRTCGEPFYVASRSMAKHRREAKAYTRDWEVKEAPVVLLPTDEDDDDGSSIIAATEDAAASSSKELGPPQGPVEEEEEESTKENPEPP